MSDIMKVSQFEIFTSKGFVSAGKILEMYRYNPNLCTVAVDGEGSLTISQQLVGSLFYRRGFWKLSSLQT